jgi:bifunctional DNase/RNase
MVLLGLGAGAPPGRAAATPLAARVELEVAGLLPMGEDKPSILVLRAKGTKTILPVVVSAGAARELGLTLAGGADHPGVLGRAIRALGATVREVELSSTDETTLDGARIRLTQNGRPVEVTARPSESVALAVSSRAPIVTRREVLEQSGLTPDDLARTHRRQAAEAEAPPDVSL